MKELEFENIVTRVCKINAQLRLKGFNVNEIDKFWSKLFVLVPKIKEVGLTNIKICTGCAHLNIEPIKPPALACCPDSNYIPIKTS